MSFRKSRVEIDGIEYRLRELSGGGLEAMEKLSSPATQGLALIALSLMGEDGPLFKPADLDQGLDHVRELPGRVINRLSDALQALNEPRMDDARKN